MSCCLIRGSTTEEATNNVVNCQIPKLQELMERKEITVDNIDVFCEKGVFGLDDTRKIFEAGKAVGLAINFHGDELHPMKAAEVISSSCYFTLCQMSAHNEISVKSGYSTTLCDKQCIQWKFCCIYILYYSLGDTTFSYLKH